MEIVLHGKGINSVRTTQLLPCRNHQRWHKVIDIQQKRYDMTTVCMCVHVFMRACAHVCVCGCAGQLQVICKLTGLSILTLPTTESNSWSRETFVSTPAPWKPACGESYRYKMYSSRYPSPQAWVLKVFENVFARILEHISPETMKDQKWMKM